MSYTKLFRVIFRSFLRLCGLTAPIFFTIIFFISYYSEFDVQSLTWLDEKKRKRKVLKKFYWIGYFIIVTIVFFIPSSARCFGGKYITFEPRYMVDYDVKTISQSNTV